MTPAVQNPTQTAFPFPPVQSSHDPDPSSPPCKGLSFPPVPQCSPVPTPSNPNPTLFSFPHVQQNPSLSLSSSGPAQTPATGSFPVSQSSSVPTVLNPIYTTDGFFPFPSTNVSHQGSVQSVSNALHTTTSYAVPSFPAPKHTAPAALPNPAHTSYPHPLQSLTLPSSSSI